MRSGCSAGVQHGRRCQHRRPRAVAWTPTGGSLRARTRGKGGQHGGCRLRGPRKWLAARPFSVAVEPGSSTDHRPILAGLPSSRPTEKKFFLPDVCFCVCVYSLTHSHCVCVCSQSPSLVPKVHAFPAVSEAARANRAFAILRVRWRPWSRTTAGAHSPSAATAERKHARSGGNSVSEAPTGRFREGSAERAPSSGGTCASCSRRGRCTRAARRSSRATRA